MNSAIASNINGGGIINQQVASGSHSSLLMSSIDFSLTEIKTNFTPVSNKGKYLIKLSGKEEVLNGQHKNKNWDQNKNPIENANITVNGNFEKNAEDTIPVPKVQLFMGRINTEWHQVYKIGAGLSNLGNTCFMNTVIQCLTYCPPLANYLLHDNDHASKCNTTGFCMMCLLQRHMRKVIGKTGEVIKPLDVYQRLKVIAKHFQFGRQEDAHEFLRYVIDHLWKACLPQTNGLNKLDSASKETTVINKIFGGYHRSQVICMRCKKESNTFDHFMDFILDIRQNVMTLEKALEKFTQPELLQQENCYKCPKCKMKVEAQKRFSVHRAPTVATFQLKRFDYNRTFGGKITKQITYPEKLNLRPYMSENKGEPVWYRLNAVLVHAGPSCNAGHYYCYVRNSNGFWYIMDDQRVQQVSLNCVLSQSAYVLFYIQVENSERVPLKKCLANKSSFTKGVISNNHFAKSPEVNSLKSMPLREKSPFANSNQQLNAPKKFNSISAPNREKISFGFRPGLSPSAYISPKNKIVPSSASTKSVPPAPISTNKGGLVPYVEDSSESSDASESYPVVNKKNNILNGDVDSSIKNTSLGGFSPSSVKKNTVLNENLDDECSKRLKNSIVDSSSSSPCLEIRKKLSKSVFNNSPGNLVRNGISKVSVSGNWIVTDSSDTASSSSSICSSNTKSEWQVTAIDDDDPPRTNEKKGIEIKEKDSVKLSVEKHMSKHIEDTSDTGNSYQKTDHESSLSAVNCNFRKQQEQFQPHFLDKNKETVQNSVKRKYGDSPSKVSENSSQSEHNENRHSPLPKKVKYSEKSPFLTLGNGMKDSPRFTSVESSTLKERQYPASNCESSSRTHFTDHVFDGQLLSFKNSFNSPDKKKIGSPNIDNTHTKGKHKEENGFPESPRPQYGMGDLSVSNQANNTSLYGTEVPTWRGENRYRPSIVPSHERRRSFDEYDEEFDRGKVRKSKVRDHRQYFRGKNPFQKHSDRYNNKYSGKFYNNYSPRKFYNSNYNNNNWKPKHGNNYPRYRNHHQRHRY